MRGIRRALALSAVLALLPAPSFAQDPYADYRIPEHGWRSWTANLQSTGVRGVGTSQFGQAPFTSGSLFGSVATKLLGGFDSDPRSSQYSFSLAANGSGSHDHTHDEFGSNKIERNDGGQNARQALTAFYGLSLYPMSAPLGYAASVSAAGNLNQQWNSYSLVNSSPLVESHSTSNSTLGSATGDVVLTASVSFGRVRDATPVYQVEVLEHRLLELGTITRPLSKGARERLASLYTVEGDVSFAHDRPTKYFWGELERLLAEDGALGPGGLDAYAVQRLLEPLTISGSGVVARARGFAVGPQVLLRKTWTHQSDEFASRNTVFVADTLFQSQEFIQPRTKRDDHDESIFSGAFVEYHRPFGTHWQVDAASRGLLSESGDNLSASSSLSASWQVADRWYIAGGIAHSLNAPGHGSDRHVEDWNVIGSVSLNYFFEDAWAFQIGAADLQTHNFGIYTRQDSYQVGVTWRFAGWLSAPGLFQPMRLSPPAH